ncbi:NADPH-dependent FMN reductase [Rarobacter incanus]|uniref:NAD(P)H-dependent FMN reductase n=1 Tax=Rarobacter incanus TaxID=153494 RepID=A0A542SN42_9MICO|nr:NAD(P)H-dependent oxidoreductase [Rarobacter incanus]TQK76049.1 NAD(P)H-dependent FMN reductase [Rarobacter incanus]
MTKVMIIVGSVRPGRIGLPIARWVNEIAENDGRFEIDFADLADIALPLMDEPKHPRLRQYEHEHTIAWSKRVAAADAFILVTPEYNHSFSPAIKNALDYLSVEWNRKPVAFVAYGGVSGGTRGVVALAEVLACLGMVKTHANVELHLAMTKVTDGAFAGDERQAAGVKAILDEFSQLAPALAELRAEAK